MKRPFGISFLAFIWALAGIGYVVMGLKMTTSVTFGPLEFGGGTWFWGWVIVLTGLLFWAAAGAAWTLQPWAWMLGMFLAAWGLLQGFFIIIGYGTWEMALAATGWPVFVLWYLNRDVVKKAFGVTDDI
jgi:hypothetical protein